MKHAGVVEYKEFIPEFNAVVMEFVELGTVNAYLQMCREPIGNFGCRLIFEDWGLRLKWCLQLATTVAFIHRNGIVHRDIRCVNILVTDIV